MAHKATSLLVLLLVAVLSTTEKPKGYTTKYDDVDVERVLNNGRILTNYIKCVMDEGPCTPEGRELKSKLT
jgi:Insect pheromone-binding family, A10/OS-D.